MTLRARLGWGLFAIAVVLIVPLLLSLRALEHLYETSRLLRDREFAASMVLGSFRERTDDTRRAEDALLFIHDQKSSSRMQSQIDSLVSMTDSLARYRLDLSASAIRSSLDALRSAAREEYEQASTGRGAVAEMISQQRTRPAIAAVDSSLGVSATMLRNRTRRRVADATTETLNAERFVAASLIIALLIALGIAIWLLRSISGPVYELERGMHAIAEGDLGQQLRLPKNEETEFGRLAASYQKMARQLAELERLRAEFVGVASHELKTPINVIIGYLELLQEGIYGELSPQQKGVLDTINKQANTLTRLVKRLLDISRFEASGGKLDVRQMDLERFFRTLESSFSVLASQRDIAFTIDHRPPLPATVQWDEDRINEVLGNLLSNAFKFSDRGGKVSLTVASADSQVGITVADTGAGIPPEQLPHIFDKFFQADNQAAAATKGTGLGLAIAKEIVEAHGGRIKVDSTVGKGTTFVVTLPTEPTGAKKRREPAPKG
ncbi:MAG TPA: HAMP domain-containing sensor histidine kinase [Gemmatimonadaceae bacterium]|nr:HAMP domain-containing sensor histidine kinase [Gemmatimonadaceae bacterium]